MYSTHQRSANKAAEKYRLDRLYEIKTEVLEGVEAPEGVEVLVGREEEVVDRWEVWPLKLIKMAEHGCLLQPSRGPLRLGQIRPILLEVG
jgi:hypothetical protein